MVKDGVRQQDGAGSEGKRSGTAKADRAGSKAFKQDENQLDGDRHQEDWPAMTATAITLQHDWVKTVLFDRGYLARIRGDAIKVYLAIIEASGGLPDRSLTISLSHLMQRTKLSCPTVIESLGRLEDLGLVVSTTHQRGKMKTYYICDPPALRTEITP
jgi:hypothetical protein